MVYIDTATFKDSRDLETDVKLPFVIKNKILMSPGVWNNYYYSPTSIVKAFTNTKWDSKETRSLFLDHEDRSSQEWIGEVVNPKIENENIIGDLVFVDKATAIKLAYGAKMGISPKVTGEEEGGEMLNFSFDNFSVVINPAVKTAYINNREVEVNKMADTKEVVVENKVEAKVETQAPAPAPVESQIEMSDAELLETTTNSAWTDFVAECRKKDPGMSFKDIAIEFKKQKPAEKPVEPEAEKVENKETKVDNKQDEILSALQNILKELAKKESPVPYEKKEEAKCEENSDKSIEMLDKANKVIVEMQQKIETMEKRFNEPEKVSVKTEEMSQKDVKVNPDIAFLNYLKTI